MMPDLQTGTAVGERGGHRFVQELDLGETGLQGRTGNLVALHGVEGRRAGHHRPGHR